MPATEIVISRWYTPLFLAGAVLAAPGALAQSDIVRGPVEARVVSVYDGDTLTVDARIWPGQTVRTAVRIDGVDTPEIRGKCAQETALALQARDYVRALAGERIELTDIHHGKYAGRVVAVVWVNGQRLDQLLVAQGLGRAYDGGRRAGWC